MNLTHDYNVMQIDINKAIVKWKPFLQSKFSNANLSTILDSGEFVQKIANFLERYSILDPPTVVTSSFSRQFPDSYIPIDKSFELILEDIEDFVCNDPNTKSKIVSEYFNIITMKKGILLENGLKIEDGVIIDRNHRKKLNDILIGVLDKRIEYILCQDSRKKWQRKDKLERILKLG